MNKKSKHKKSLLPHLSVLSIILVIIILVGVVYFVQRSAGEKALGGQAIQLPKTYIPPPPQSTISPEVLKSAGVVMQSEFDAKVKEVIKDSLSFRNGEEGLTCQQICQRAPGVVGNLYGVKFTSQCVAVIGSGFSAPAEKVILASSDKTYYTNGFIASCEKPLSVTEEGSTLCLCI